MTTLRDRRFVPDPTARLVYNELYELYRELYDVFGGVRAGSEESGLGTIMKRLLSIRECVLAR